MTIDTSTTAGKIAVMEAFRRGEKIQVWTPILRDWSPLIPQREEENEPSWDWNRNDYRIEPREPREFTILLSSTGFPSAVGYASDSCIIVPPHLSPGEVTTIKVREVIE